MIESDRSGIRTHSHIIRKRTLDHLAELVRVRLMVEWFFLNGWVFIYELTGCGFESCSCHLNFKYRACFEQQVPSHPGKL